ncbi:hypothetical protein M8C13_42305 [Crossiella sp. SN42]|uniref:hypothetical protein n=1 Tax=Crossiella sp. SN42 TaxID=2944808 RepID=UPI00207D3F4A|nr:hypothetical protein [Crossiella sp. SN42]MCO1582402.1 hypothetical protein [Crossiella sp. SN42]
MTATLAPSAIRVDVVRSIDPHGARFTFTDAPAGRTLAELRGYLEVAAALLLAGDVTISGRTSTQDAAALVLGALARHGTDRIRQIAREIHEHSQALTAGREPAPVSVPLPQPFFTACCGLAVEIEFRPAPEYAAFALRPARQCRARRGMR